MLNVTFEPIGTYIAGDSCTMFEVVAFVLHPIAVMFIGEDDDCSMLTLRMPLLDM